MINSNQCWGFICFVNGSIESMLSFQYSMPPLIYSLFMDQNSFSPIPKILKVKFKWFFSLSQFCSKQEKNFSCWGADLHVISMKKEKLQPRWLWWLNYVQNMAIFNLLIYPMNLAEILRINSKWCNKTVKKIWYVKSTFDSSSWKVQTVYIDSATNFEFFWII